MKILLRLIAALLACLIAAAPPANGQTAAMYRIGYISPESEVSGRATFEAFRSGLRELGYEEGKNTILDAHWAGASDELLKQIGNEMMQSKPNVIVAQTRGVFFVRQPGSTVPVVFGFSGDPVVAKLAVSLAHPGGNFTGISMMSLDLTVKRMELLKELMPRLKRVAIIANPGHAGEEAEHRASDRKSVV